jgi:Domain of unknown function (DU1801)
MLLAAGYDGRMAIQTRPTGADVNAFLDSVADEKRRTDAHALRALIERVTGAPAEMWGPAILGFGSRMQQGRTGETEWLILGFSPRAAALTLYGVFSIHRAPDPLFERLGPHTTAKGCLYIKRLDAVDFQVLEQLIREAWERGGE